MSWGLSNVPWRSEYWAFMSIQKVGTSLLPWRRELNRAIKQKMKDGILARLNESVKNTVSISIRYCHARSEHTEEPFPPEPFHLGSDCSSAGS